MVKTIGMGFLALVMSFFVAAIAAAQLPTPTNTPTPTQQQQQNQTTPGAPATGFGN